tara:strand:+ start:444 stop:596 length:153 start_codon:yes stop_codon:yes gene_type:complete
MLFKFGKFWKTVLFLMFSWVIYVAFGYEFALVTIGALIYSNNFKDKHTLL